MRVLALVVLLLVAAPAQAATTTFTGSVDREWNTAGNWSAGIPTTADDAIIPAGKVAVLATGAGAARKLSVEAGSTLHVARDLTLAGGVSENAGTLVWEGGSIGLGDATLRNSGEIVGASPHQTLRIAQDGAQARVENVAGATIRKEHSLDLVIDPPLHNDGRFRVARGTASVHTAGDVAGTGSFEVESDGVLRVPDGRELVLGSGASITGGGAVHLDGRLDVPAGAGAFAPALTTLSGGRLHTAKPLTLTRLTSDGDPGSTVSGDGPVTAGGPTNLANVVLSAGAITFDGPGLTATGTLFVATTLTLADGGDWSAGTWHLAGKVVNAGRLTVTGDSPEISISGGDPEVVNTGTIVRDGPGTWSVMAPLRSSGTLHLLNGTLAAPAGVVIESGTLRAIGTVAGDLANTAGTVELGASPGRLTVTGDYAQGATATLRVGSESAPFPLEDRLSVGGTATLGGYLSVFAGSEPPPATAVDVVTAEAVEGAFAAVFGTAGPGHHLEASYPGGAVRLTVVQTPPAPENVTPPSIPAAAREGQTVTCDPGTWSPAAEQLRFGWYFQRHGQLTPVPVQTSTITIPIGMSVTAVICTVVASNGVSENWHVMSNRLLVVGPAPVNEVAPTVTASGDTLTCDPGRWTGTGAITYGWLRDGTPIEGQTALTYLIADADAGRGISCRSTSTDAAGSVSADSNVIAIPARPVPPPPPPAVTPAPPRTPVTVPIGRLATLPSARRCAGPRSLRLRLRAAGARAELFVDGRRVKVVDGRARVVLRRLPRGRWTLKIVVTTAAGERRQATRRFRTCTSRS